MKAQFHLTGIPRVLMDAIEARARTLGTSPANVVAECLCGRYHVEFKPAKQRPDKRSENVEYVRHSDGQALGLVMNLRLPSDVVDALRKDSSQTQRTQRAIVLEVVAKSLSVKLPKPRNKNHGRPRGRKTIVA